MKLLFLFVPTFLLGACGTAYQMPKVDPNDKATAASVLAQEAAVSTKGSSFTSADIAVKNFVAAASRVEPAAEKFCASYATKKLDCNIKIVIDRDFSAPPNAFQTYRDGVAVVAFTPSMILKARNQDEIAFILGHEMGHHMVGHIDKAKTQAAVGAIALGILGAVATANDPYTSQHVKDDTVRNMAELGEGIGDHAYSQTYELEADMIGARIAQIAGYDPIKGARIFARVEKADNPDGSKSFWGTHPKSEARIAVVSATMRAIHNGEVMAAKQSPKN